MRTIKGDNGMRKDRDYVFLSGPVKYEADGGHGWRDEVYRYACNCDWYLRVFDPTSFFDYEWSDEFQKTDRQIKEYYLQAIRKATVVLVNLNYTECSVGTGIEVQAANDAGVPCVGWGKEHVYPWVRDACTVVFDDLKTALEYITSYYDFDL